MTTSFPTIIADPPWQHSDKLGKRGAASRYHTMPTVDICNLRLPPIAYGGALLFLWKVASMQQDALDVIQAWGFTPKSELVWFKTTKACGSELGGYDRNLKRGTAALPTGTPAFKLGRTARMCHETCIIATRGKTSGLVKSKSIRSVFFAPVGAHSAKPDAFYDIVEAMTEGPIAELFARRERGGRFTCFGDEIGSRLEVAPGDLFRGVGA